MCTQGRECGKSVCGVFGEKIKKPHSSLFVLHFLYEAYSIGADALFATSEAETLGGSGFDGYLVGIATDDFCKTCLHGFYMRVYLWTLCADGGIDIAEAVALGG